MASNLPEGEEFELNSPWSDPGDCPEWMECRTCHRAVVFPEDSWIGTECSDCFWKSNIEINNQNLSTVKPVFPSDRITRGEG